MEKITFIYCSRSHAYRSQGMEKNIEVKMTYVLSFQLFKNMRRMDFFFSLSLSIVLCLFLSIAQFKSLMMVKPFEQ